MAIQTAITCDHCGSRVTKASHTRIKFGREPEKREPMDLCGECRDLVLESLGQLPPTLPGMSPSELAAAGRDS